MQQTAASYTHRDRAISKTHFLRRAYILFSRSVCKMSSLLHSTEHCVKPQALHYYICRFLLVLFLLLLFRFRCWFHCEYFWGVKYFRNCCCCCCWCDIRNNFAHWPRVANHHKAHFTYENTHNRSTAKKTFTQQTATNDERKKLERYSGKMEPNGTMAVICV